MTPVHGGPDAAGIPQWDFSTNANACGPCPSVLSAVQQADPSHYPDPHYTALRLQLAAFHEVEAWRVVLGASASELIARITAAVALGGGQRVWMPTQVYGDCARAAHAWGLTQVNQPTQAHLCWLCEPSSPLGANEAQALQVLEQGKVVVLDRAYEPLRLSGACSLDAPALERVWQLWSPNKATGLTGVRGAYAIAPHPTSGLLRTLESLAPSWPLGAHGVALLNRWVHADVQQWLANSRAVLVGWKAKQIEQLTALGWHCLPSQANYFCAHAPHAVDVPALRSQGIKLRDATSFGLPGHWRLGVLPPAAQVALVRALQTLQKGKT